MARQNRRAGFTLVEALVATAILAVAVTAVGMALAAGHMESGHSDHSWHGARLAEELMERVLSRPYYDPQGPSAPGPEADETAPAQFDNMDDFHGYVEEAGELTDVSAANHADEYQAFGRQVTVAYGQGSIGAWDFTVAGLTVTVTVTDGNGMVCRLVQFVPQPVR